MDLFHFNPRSATEKDFLAGFVARADVFEHLLRALRSTDGDTRHHLIVAPRGFGKTSLLRRCAIAVRTDAELAQRYIALSFREEQHNVISLDVFWRNCIQSLLELREDEGASADEIADIDDAWDRLAPRQGLARIDQDGDPAWLEFRERCAALGRRPLLLLDNLDALLAGLCNEHQWLLRSILQRPDGPIVLAAAPRHPDATSDREAAFYDFFRVETLEKLGNDEVRRCLSRIAEQRGEPGKAVLTLLANDPGRVSALNTLAGGNPRTLGVLYSVLESHLDGDVLSQLSAMLDTFTGWYQARTEELPMQARAVFDALALNWDPMTAAALGAVTGLETTIVSSQLTRLERLQFVETVPLSSTGKGRSGFQVSERFYNLWYLMRNGPRRARNVVRFLTVLLRSCFSASERDALVGRVLDGHRFEPEVMLALASTAESSDLRARLIEAIQEANKSSAMPIAFDELLGEFAKGYFADQGEQSRAVAPGEQHSSVDESLDSPEPIARALVDGLYAIATGSGGQELAKRIAAAIGDVEEGINKQSTGERALARGIVAMSRGEHHVALELIVDAAKSSSKRDDPIVIALIDSLELQTASMYLKEGRVEEVIEQTGQILARDRACGLGSERLMTARTYVLRAEALRRVKRLDESLNCSTLAIRLLCSDRRGPESDTLERAHLTAGVVQFARLKFRDSKSHLEAAFALRPDRVATMFALGTARICAGDAPGAIEILESAVLHEASEAKALWSRCIAAQAYMLSAGGEGRALEHIHLVLEHSEQAAHSLVAHARSLLRIADGASIGEVLAEFGVGMSDDPTWSAELLNIGMVLLTLVQRVGAPSLIEWCEANRNDVRLIAFANGVLAALRGRDVLLSISPEQREVAVRVCEALEHNMRAFASPDASP